MEASALGAALCFVAVACRTQDVTSGVELGTSESEGRYNVAVYPLPVEPMLDDQLVSLGRRLFFSRVVADDESISCASCHLPEHGFADVRPFSQGAHRPETQTNTPSLWNVAYLDVFNWAGKQVTLGEHLDGLIQNPDIIGTTWPALFGRLRARPEWSEALRAAFPNGATEQSPRAALIAYERSLVSVGSAFDRWQRGDDLAVSAEARAGFELFLSRGCVSCHQGRLLGGNVFERLGIVRPYFTQAEHVSERDLGRYALTQHEEDRHVFRVPSLRNVALTGPYLHDGSLSSLVQTIGVMATYQLGRELDADQILQIVAFLETLSTDAREQAAQDRTAGEPTP